MIREGMTSPMSPFFQSPHGHSHHPDFSMSMHHQQGSSRGPPPQLPGGGGLYNMSELSNSRMSFSMSMADHSTSLMHSRGGGMGQFRGAFGDGSGVKDLNNYLPIHKIKLDEYPQRLFTVENNMTRETIVVVACSQKVMLFMLKVKTDESDQKPAEKFEFIKFHELFLQPHDLKGFAISQNCSITLVPLKLTYALSTRGEKVVYAYDQKNSNQVPASLAIGDLQQTEETFDSLMMQFHHDYPVTHLAIDAEKDYIACIEELGSIIVWDLQTKTKVAVFHIPHQGIYISFHRSEPFQLMVIDSSGWARFFNVFRQCCFRSIFLVQPTKDLAGLEPTVFSAEWSLSNSSIFSVGFAESFAIIDSCKVISSMQKCYEVPEQVINAVRINPNDDKVYATLSRLTGTIQLWRDNFSTNIWKHQNEHVTDIAWVQGYPYLLALGHQTIYIYETSSN